MCFSSGSWLFSLPQCSLPQPAWYVIANHVFMSSCHPGQKSNLLSYSLMPHHVLQWISAFCT
jgi:hypothetical protein